MSDAITRKEAYLKSIGNGTSSALKPITREEQYLAYIAGDTNSFPTTPITREEAFLDKIAKKGAGNGGSGINVQPVTLTSNGTHNAPEGIAWSPVNVNVPEREDGKLCKEDYLEEGMIKGIWEIPGEAPVVLRCRSEHNTPFTVDWGDGTVEEYPYGSSGTYANHTYKQKGFYAFKIAPNKRLQIGIDTTTGGICDFNFTSGQFLRKLYIDNPNIWIQYLGTQGMTHCEIKQYAAIYDNAFKNCSNLQTLVIPDGMTSVNTRTFESCSSLYNVEFPKTVTKVVSGVFNYCYRLDTIDFSKCDSVPTLSGALASPSYIKHILVPSALYDEWIVATNWATYADQIVAV